MKIFQTIRSLACAALASAAFAVTASNAVAATYYYVNWTAANVAAGTASGTITLPDSSVVTVNFQALNADNTPGTLFGAQTSGGTNYWVPSAPYVGTTVSNAPPDTDILQLAGGLNQRYRVTLSEAVRDPIMPIVSLGSPGTAITYNFTLPFTILSQGTGYWGGTSTSLTALSANILQGAEGHGTVQFSGSISQIEWTVPTSEAWHGFTFGIRTTERIDPIAGRPIPTNTPWAIALLLATILVAGGLRLKARRSK